MSNSRIPSPARSQGAVITPRRYKNRRTQSVGSPARSTNSGRLSAIIQFKENNKSSFVLSPMPSRRSVLNDDTDIEEPRRRSWWKKLSDNSRDVMEVLNDNKILETNEAVEQFIDIEVLSQEKKNYSLDLPESSDGESISSIVIPQRKLFTQKNMAEDKFGQLMGSRETLAKLHKSVAHEKTIHVAPKNLFNQPSKPKSKPTFPAALLNLSPNKTANKTKEMTAVQVKSQARNLFGNRKSSTRKNMFAEFIMSDSEEEISEIQPKIFAFENKVDQRESSTSRRDPSPTSSVTADIEMDDWNLLPSSTMVENQLEDVASAVKTPKKTHLSNLSEVLESENDNANTSINKTRQSYKSASKNKSKISADVNTDGNVEISGSIKNKSKLSSGTDKNDKSSRKSKGNVSHDRINDIANISSAKRPRISNSPDAIVYASQVTQNSSINNSKHITKSITKNKLQISGDKNIEALTEKSILTRSSTNNTSKNQNTSQFIVKEQLNDEVISNEDDDLNMSLVYDEDDIESIKSNQETIDQCDINNHYDKSIKTQKQKTESQSKTRKLNSASHNSKVSSQIQDLVQNKSITGSEKSHQSFDQKNETLLKKNKEEIFERVQNKSQKDNQNEIREKLQYDNHDKTKNHVENEDNEGIQIDSKEGTERIEDQDNNVKNKSHNSESENEYQAQDSLDIGDEQDDDDENAIEEENEDIQKLEEENKQDDEVEEMAEESLEVGPEENNDETEQVIERIDDSLEHNKEIQRENEEVSEELEESQKIEQDSEEIEHDNEEANVESDESQEIENEEVDDEFEESPEIEQSSAANEDDSNESEQDTDHKENFNREEEENPETEEENYQEDDQEENVDMQEESQEVERSATNAEIEDTNEDNEEEIPNDSHDTTGRNRKKIDSPEVILRDNTKQNESFIAKGRNTSLRRTSIMKNMNIRPSLAPPRDSTGFSDGKNSSAEGSGWDSHRTTRKTLRQTFGKDFTPRKSLRALVMEKSAKRQTAITDTTAITSKFPQANSTELPEASNIDDEIDNHDEGAAEPIHEISKRTRQTTLETYLQKIKEQNIERRMKIEENVKNSLKVPIRDISNTFKVPSKPMFAIRKSNSKQHKKPKPVKSTLIPLDDLPPEVIDDMKYKPPKRYQPSNAAWITKRLYKFLESKLEPEYDYKARVRAEKLVESIYNFAKELRRHPAVSADMVDRLKYEMAKLDVVKTHFDFYQFFHDFMPREIRVKVVPDVVNKLPLPRHGVFSDILRANTVQG